MTHSRRVREFIVFEKINIFNPSTAPGFLALFRLRTFFWTQKIEDISKVTGSLASKTGSIITIINNKRD